jgi:hypothetical protein
MKQTLQNTSAMLLDQQTPCVAYETRMSRDLGWALAESSQFFEGKGAVQDTLRKITKRLRELGVSYGVVGGLALFAHGFRRYTEDVDLLVTRKDLLEIHRQLEGLGYLPPFQGSKNLRDTDTGVKIEFLVAGEFPGDGKPKPIAFPDPADVAVENNGIQYVNLPTLLNLKIASGMSTVHRMRDLVDVQDLLKTVNLPLDFAEQLHPYVRDKYRELWHAIQPQQVRYVRFWRHYFGAKEAKNLGELMSIFQQCVSELQAMLADGVILEPIKGSMENGFLLVTSDPEIAKKYDLHDEKEVFYPGS